MKIEIFYVSEEIFLKDRLQVVFSDDFRRLHFSNVSERVADMCGNNNKRNNNRKKTPKYRFVTENETFTILK